MDITKLYEFITNDEYKTIKDFITGNKILILGLSDKKYLPESFPAEFNFRAYDLKPPSEEIPRVEYLKADVRELDYESLKNEFRTIISHNVCHKGNAQVINELINDLNGFETIIIKFCDNTRHYKDVKGLSATEKTWLNALSLEEQLNNLGYNTKVMWTRWKETRNEMPYLLIATNKKITNDITIEQLINEKINQEVRTIESYFFNTALFNEEFYKKRAMLKRQEESIRKEFEGVTIKELRREAFNELKRKKEPHTDNVTLAYFERIIN